MMFLWMFELSDLYQNVLKLHDRSEEVILFLSINSQIFFYNLYTGLDE